MTTVEQPGALAIGDFDRDGRPDIAVQGVETIEILLGRGDGSFRHGETLFSGGLGAGGVVVADLNRDGIPDLVDLVLEGAPITPFLGLGDGRFATRDSLTVGGDPGSIAVADLNRDGIADLLVGGLGRFEAELLLGRAGATFAPARHYAAGLFPFSVATADVDRDGIPDLVVVADDSSLSKSTIGVLLGRGDGSYRPVKIVASNGSAADVRVADIDRDGKPDLVVTVSVGVVVLPGRGDGTFGGPIGPASAARAPVVADLDRDGKLDLVAAGGSHSVRVLLGDGRGRFMAPVTFATGGVTSAIAVQDLNGDGKPDLVVANISTNSVSVLLNATP